MPACGRVERRVVPACSHDGSTEPPALRADVVPPGVRVSVSDREGQKGGTARRAGLEPTWPLPTTPTPSAYLPPTCHHNHKLLLMMLVIITIIIIISIILIIIIIVVVSSPRRGAARSLRAGTVTATLRTTASPTTPRGRPPNSAFQRAPSPEPGSTCRCNAATSNAVT